MSDIEKQVDALIDARPHFADMEPACQSQAIRINDFIYMSKGTSNAYMVVTDAGRVIINTGMGFEARTHKKIFDAVCPGPHALYRARPGAAPQWPTWPHGVQVAGTFPGRPRAA